MPVNVNFLRFLVSHSSVEPFLSSLLTPLFHSLPSDHVYRVLSAEADLFRKRNVPRKIGLYLHIPFCRHKCAFCHCSHFLMNELTHVEHYVKGLQKEIGSIAKIFSGVDFHSVSLGGGTPSALSEKMLETLLSKIRSAFSVPSSGNINCEVSPSTVSDIKLKILRKFGVGRISLGVQSLDPFVLKKAGRPQTKKKILDVSARIKEFALLNVDLMAGLPGQSIEIFMEDLKQVIRTGADSVNINPFASVIRSDYKEGYNKILSEEMFALREKMLADAMCLLLQEGYRSWNGQVYFRTEQAVSAHDRLILTDASIVGVGAWARTRIWGKGIWMQKWEKNNFLYDGLFLGDRYFLAEYCIHHLQKGIDLGELRKKFKACFDDEISLVAEFLGKRSGLFSYKKGVLLCKAVKKADLFDAYAYAQLFYGKRILETLRRFFMDTYRDEIDYSFYKDSFLRSMDDDTFLVALNRASKKG